MATIENHTSFAASPENLRRLTIALKRNFAGKPDQQPPHLFHLISTGQDTLIGVVGDGNNCWYEWLILTGDTLRISDRGYGWHIDALRDGLKAFTNG